MRVLFHHSRFGNIGSAGAALLALACSGGTGTDALPTGMAGGAVVSGAVQGGGGTNSGVPSGGGATSSAGTGLAGMAPIGGNAGGNLNAGGGGNPAAAGMGTGGTTLGGAGESAVGGAGGSLSGAETPSCDGIVAAGYEVCSSGPGFCAAVFTDGAGCGAVCAAAGLECAEVWEDAEGSCAAATERGALSCSDAEHDSDYCVCRGAGSPGGAGNGGGGTNEPAGAGAGGEGGAGSGGEENGGAGSGGGENGGAGGTISGSAGAGNVPDIGPGSCGCEEPAGEFGTVNATIVVGSGEVYDGACQVFRANPSTLGAGNQDEGQSPIFEVEDGGTLRNIVINTSGADGIHTYGDVLLENIHWLDIGEDAMTVKASGTVRLNCGSSAHGEDKTFQVNAASDIFISNFTATDAGKFMRQNGDTTFAVNVTIDHCDISLMDEAIFRTDSSSSHVTFTNSRYSNIGDGLFIFGDSIVDGNSGQSTVSNNQEY